MDWHYLITFNDHSLVGLAYYKNKWDFLRKLFVPSHPNINVGKFCEKHPLFITIEMTHLLKSWNLYLCQECTFSLSVQCFKTFLRRLRYAVLFYYG
jgi:hypothetical protein